MADQDLHLLDDNPNATPLDLLLNAITGTDPYHFAAEAEGEERGEQLPMYLDPGLESGELGEAGGSSRKRALESPRLERAAKAPRLTPLAQGVLHDFSTVEVWHPKTGQKSYGKERRIIQPPPTLRVTGPLLPHLTVVTLSAGPSAGDSPVFSSQTHRVGHTSEREPPTSFYAGGGKKAERDDKRRIMRHAAAKTGWGGTLPWERSREDMKARDELSEGLAFPGLWVGEDPSKSKEFRLQLTIADPAAENGETTVVAEAAVLEPATIAEAAALDTGAPLDADSLHQVLGDAVIATMGDIPVDEPAPLVDDLGQASLASLEETQQTLATATADQPDSAEPKSQEIAPPKPWATFVSDPLTLVSKPSQKTAKARSMASCLSTTDAFALWVRVNAQTVRTKYMKLDGGESESEVPELAARAGKWSPFRFEVLRRAAPPETEDKNPRARFKLDVDREAGVVTYGSIVCLVDVHSGVRTAPMLLVRVDKNEAVVGGDHGHPVSELQRVGFVRVLDNYEVDLEGGSRWYLSAPGALAGAGEVKVTRQRGAKAEAGSHATAESASTSQPPVPETLSSLETLATDAAASQEPSGEGRKRKKKTKRHALAKAAIDEEEQGSTAAGLTWNPSKRREGEQPRTGGKATTANAVTIETVDDFMCWVLGGVACFSYSIFNGGGDGNSLPVGPLDPVPRLLADPVFQPEHNALDLTLSHFFVPDAAGGVAQPFSVYLGPIGPLPFTTWRSVAPKDKYYDPSTVYPAIHYDGSETDSQLPGAPDGRRVYSNFPYSVPHVIANVDLPDPDEVARVIQEYAGAAQPADAIAPPPDQVEAEPTEAPDTAAATAAAAVAADDNSWLGVMGPAGELTIQEALRNAGKSDLGLGGSADATQPADAPVDAAAFELEHLPSDLIAPTLDLAGVNGGNDDATADAPAGGAQLASATASGAPSTVALSRPEPATREGSTAQHLPILLVRPDGAGHGIGWSVVVQRATDSQQQPATPGASAPWGLRVVKLP